MHYDAYRTHTKFNHVSSTKSKTTNNTSYSQENSFLLNKWNHTYIPLIMTSISQIQTVISIVNKMLPMLMLQLVKHSFNKTMALIFKSINDFLKRISCAISMLLFSLIHAQNPKTPLYESVVQKFVMFQLQFYLMQCTLITTEGWGCNHLRNSHMLLIEGRALSRQNIEWKTKCYEPKCE